jgi:hypothetical protein
VNVCRRYLTVALVLLASATAGRAEAPVPPPDLPRYDLAVDIDPAANLATFRVTTTWTNPAQRPANDLIFNFYPMFKVPKGDELLFAKTLELFRMFPSYGFDKKGGHGVVRRLTGAGDRPLSFAVVPDNPTAFRVELPAEVPPGGSVTVTVEGTIRLAEIQGRWGQWDGIAYLSNAMPTLAYYNHAGWNAMPFVPWHQPFWNEAGVYTGTVTVPASHALACSAEVTGSTTDGPRKTCKLKPFVGRDFAMIASAKFAEFTADCPMPDGRTVKIRVCALKRHEFYAVEILKMVAEALPVYAKWFGPYPYEHFTIAESFFGWNGNECAGLVMIDERVFDMPHLARGYVEYLVSHEVCHQWWYNLVGTNGYSETFIDEGLATYLAHRLLDQKHGPNNDFLQWPAPVEWLPNIRRENYRYASLTGAIRRGDAPAAAGPLPEFGHLIGLFSGAYDRGSKFFGMIEQRLGTPAFEEFLRELAKKYAFRLLSAEALQAELTAFAGPATAAQWKELFDRWVYSNGLTDWAVDGVSVRPLGGPAVGGGRGPVRVAVTVSQRREYDEPTTLGFQFADGDGYPVRVPVGTNPSPEDVSRYNLEVVPLKDGKATVRVTLPSAPTRVKVDPDRVLLDADPGNNTWGGRPNVRVVPFYTFLYDTDLTNDYDRWNVTAGPWVFGQFSPDPWYSRTSLIGARVGAYRTQQFAGGLYSAYRTDFRDLVVGADALVDHWPFARTQVGGNVEARVAGPFGGTNGQDTPVRATVFGRYVHQYGSSLYLPPINYTEVFTSYSDNFLPFARERGPDARRPEFTWTNGIHYRLNLYTPYWDAERGFWLDLTAAGGVSRLQTPTGAESTGIAQGQANFAAAHKLPDGLGYLSAVKLAGRVLVQGATANRGDYFTLGGSTQFRGFDLAQRQGSLLWVASAEVRLPVVRDARLDFADSIAGVRNVSIVPFYDAGAVYTGGDRVGNVAHALGVGARVDFAFFSFIERATLRFDVAKSINNATPFQFWFGVQHPF